MTFIIISWLIAADIDCKLCINCICDIVCKRILSVVSDIYCIWYWLHLLLIAFDIDSILYRYYLLLIATFTLIAMLYYVQEVIIYCIWYWLHLILIAFAIDCDLYIDCIWKIVWRGLSLIVASYCWGLIRWSYVFTVHINWSKISNFSFRSMDWDGFECSIQFLLIRSWKLLPRTCFKVRGGGLVELRP